MIGKILVGIVVFGFVSIILICMLYDILKCRHEWEQHKFEKGGAIKYYLTCKKCGKVRVLK